MKTLLFAALAVAIAACGDEPDEDVPPSATVCEILEQPPTDDVVIEGAAHNLFRVDHGFALSDAGCSIFVTLPRKPVASVKDGDEIEVRGRLDTLEPLQARRLRFALSRRPATAPDLEDELPGGLPMDTGDPYFDGYAIVRRLG